MRRSASCTETRRLPRRTRAEVLRVGQNRHPPRGALKEGNEIYGNHIKCKIVKNKVAPPFKTAEFDILYGKGIARSGEIVEIGIQLGIIQKSGSWFSYGDQRIAQGKENTRKYLEANPALMEEIADKIKSKRDDVEQMLAKDYGEDVEEDAEDSVDPDDEELDIRILDTDDSTEE